MKFRKFKDNLFKSHSILLLCLAIIVFIALFVGLLVKSLPLLQAEKLSDLLLGSIWSPQKEAFGFLPFITGTLWVTGIALVIAVPICIMAAIYLVEYGGNSLRKLVLPLINVLAAIPPVLYGVWGVLMVVPAVGHFIAPVFSVNSTGYSVLSGGIVLAVMIFPIMISVMVEVLKTVPQDLKAASLSLGATKWETITKVILVKARTGLLAAIILGVSRAFGETVAVLMVCGNVPGIPKSLFDAGYPLPALIANNFGEMMSIPLYDSALMFAALWLFIMILAFNIVSRMILKQMEERL
ncbi:phosphate ABC transporter permease subunit PstC [Sphingobacterium sp. UT-1RO-CII-1]|uniref:phosphate ABC transporter permease subunit PstC n=1 Tax=Sphingobacterium sp. UT-1RO-CII-1 TaxID=2995225 RepID=UPI00227B0717|nr:phosphate ABC transporter permease subunit PstC [Sphingobacterium sp. UT-1RO-CII-1]MCY4778928.1 phosphate ABC transporter permease subunit PstC [Sphingobacterium sp. UT-1RO-CII-1]